MKKKKILPVYKLDDKQMMDLLRLNKKEEIEEDFPILENPIWKYDRDITAQIRRGVESSVYYNKDVEDVIAAQTGRHQYIKTSGYYQMNELFKDATMVWLSSWRMIFYKVINDIPCTIILKEYTISYLVKSLDEDATDLDVTIICEHLDDSNKIMEGLRPMLGEPEIETPKLKLILQRNSGLYLHNSELPNIKPYDPDLHYNEGFKKFDITFKEKIKTTPGLYILHGDPGTGKTNYIRNLLRDPEINGEIIFLSSQYSNVLTDPGFMEFLIHNAKGKILMLEDAETYMRKREETGQNSAVSNILNVTDGVLGDILNLKIIATFNTEIKNIDSALLRGGRLVAKYQFDMLEDDRVQKLKQAEGIENDIVGPARLSEIYSGMYDEGRSPANKGKKIGF